MFSAACGRPARYSRPPQTRPPLVGALATRYLTLVSAITLSESLNGIISVLVVANPTFTSTLAATVLGFVLSLLALVRKPIHHP